MSPKVEQLIAEIMQLSDMKRATIAERVIATLDQGPDLQVEELWQDTISKRFADIDQGKVVPLS